MAKKKKSWVFTRKRKESIGKARKRHVEYVKLGERAYIRGERI